MIQCFRFENGGFVLHCVRVGGEKYSAWFDGAGNLTDCERKPSPGRSCAVPARCVKVRAELVKIGRRFVLATVE